MNKIIQVGNLYPDNPRNPEVGRVYDPDGIAPCLNTCGGGNRMPKIIERTDEDEKEYKILAPNNFAHKAGDGMKTRKHTIKDIVPSICANAGSTQMSYVLEIIKENKDDSNT